MRLILVNQYFWPDLAATAQLLADLAEDLAARDFEVTALASRGRYVPGSGDRPARRERWGRVEIRRIAATEFGRGRLLGRVLDYASFYLGAARVLAWGPRADAVVCLSTPPLVATLGLLARWRGARFVYKVEDLYPDVAVALGTLAPRGLLTRVTSALSRRVLARADLVVALDGAMAAVLRSRGARRVEVVPNWADGGAIRPGAQGGRALRAAWGVAPEELVVLYSGNLGLAHRFDAVAAAARLLAEESSPVRFLFVGDGPRAAELRAATAGLASVRFLPYQPREALGELYAAADVHLVTLCDEVSGLLVPSKYAAALAAGRPVLLVGGTGTDMHAEIAREGVGWALPHEAASIADALRQAAAEPGALAERGKVARKLFERQFERSMATARWAESSGEPRPSELRWKEWRAVTFEGPLVLAALALFVAALITNMLVPLVARVAVALRAVDYPGDRRVQDRPVPRLGGIALVSGLGLAAGGLTLARWSSIHSEISRVEVISLVLAATFVFLLGVIDDVVGVSAGKKFLVQILAAGLVVQVGWSFERLSLPGGVVELGWFGPVLSLIWIVGVTNAINLIDGMDGLASGVVGIIALSLLAYAVLLGETGTVILMAATAGSCLGFLRHNWAPARIFMGDSGSLTLGFLLAVASVHSAIKAPATVAILVPLLALGLPVIDTLLVMLVRFLARPKGAVATRFFSMFHADRSHIHHLMLRFGATRQRVVFWIYAAVLAFCVFAMLVAATQNPVLGALLLPLELGVIVAMRSLGLRREAYKISLKGRSELKSDLVGQGEPGEGPGAVVRPIDSRPARRRS